MEQLFIRLGTQRIDWLIWRSSSAEVIASGQLRGPAELGELTEQARSREVRVLVPGQDVVLTEVALPAGSHRLMPALVPNALEDELASDLEDLHFAWPSNARPAGLDKPFAVAVVAHANMQQWLQWLREADIECDFICSDLYALPAPAAGAWHALQLGDDILLRSGAQSGFTCDALLLPELLGAGGSIGAGGAEGAGGMLRCFGEVEASLPSGWQTQAVDIEVPFSAVAQGLAESGEAAPINLLQQRYKPKRKRRTISGLPWRPAAWAAAILLLLGYSSQVVEYVKLGQQQTQLQAAIESTYRAAFPNETRIVNVRSQLQQRLDEVGGSVGVDALQMLAALEPGFRAAQDVRVELLRFESGSMRLTARASSFASLEMFRAAATAAGALQVEQGPVSNQAGGVTGNFIVRMN